MQLVFVIFNHIGLESIHANQFKCNIDRSFTFDTVALRKNCALHKAINMRLKWKDDNSYFQEIELSGWIAIYKYTHEVLNNINTRKSSFWTPTQTWFTDLPMRFAWLVTSDLSNLKKYIVSPGEIHQPVCIQNILRLHKKCGK